MKDRLKDKLILKKYKAEDRTSFSVVGEVTIFFLIAIILTAVLSYFTLRNSSEEKVRTQREELGDAIAEEIRSELKEYPSYKWLLEYWYDHADDLDVEYEAGEKTAKKARDISERNSWLVIADAEPEEVARLSAEDQKKYAEVVYTWLLRHLNQMRETYGPAYVYIIVMEKSYEGGTFLLSGAKKDQKRGTNYGDAYVLGVKATSTPAQKLNMQLAVSRNGHLAQSGNYVDRYVYIEDIKDNMHVMVGLAFDLSEVMKETEGQVFSNMISFIMLQVTLALISLVLVFFLTLRPIERVQRNVRRYIDTKDSKAVLRDLKKIRLKNEIGALSGDISDMVVSIDQYLDEIQTITAERERIEAELSVATSIQASMLPRKFPAFPDRNEFDLYAIMDPAKEVGGDFYDYFFIDHDHLALVIADVSGKGIPAALFMVNSKTKIRNRAMMGGTPGQILSDVNEELCAENDTGFFVTVWLAIICISTGEAVASNAGHEHPVLRRAGGRYETVKYKHSPAVATVDGIPFREHGFRLSPGDRIYVYTDGVPEATDDSCELYGEERMLKALNELPDAAPKVLLDHVRKDIDDFAGDAKQFDDITMLCFDYFGSQQEKNI